MATSTGNREMSNDFNETVIAHRPAGGARSTAADMARHVQLELSRGLTPEGRRLVSETNLLERRRRGVSVGEDSWYGMGLFEQVTNGVTVVTHGGTLLGYRSNFYVLPDAGIGAVILTNSDEGSAMMAPFLRRLLEIAYDGRPEAMGMWTRLPPDPGAGDCAARTADAPRRPGGAVRWRGNPQFGGRRPHHRVEDGATWLRAGVIDAALATRRNPGRQRLGGHDRPRRHRARGAGRPGANG
jgi:hypothetical protein